MTLIQTSPLQLQEACEGEVQTLAFGGEGIIRHDNFVVFVPYTVPGDRIRFRVTQVKRSFARGRVEEVLNPSPFRIIPPCPIYLTCGGCQHQELNYEKSVEEKSRILEELLKHGLGLDAIPMEPPLPSPKPYEYRHKMQVAVGQSTDGKLSIGLYQPFSHRIVDMPTCPVQHPINNLLLDAFRKSFPSLGWPVYDETNNTGLVRHFIGRVNQRGEAYAVLVATRNELPGWETLLQALRSAVPKLKGFAVNVNPMRTNVVLGSKTHVLWGEKFLEETIGNHRFRFGPTSFFQVSPPLLPAMTQKILEWIDPSPDDHVLDLYCGVGTFTLPIAAHANHVTGIEENAKAIRWANENAKLNNISNVRFIAGKAEEAFQSISQSQISKSPNPLVVVDPPRQGMHANVIKQLIRMNPKRIVYLSCNPGTLARDLKALLQKGWVLKKTLAADFFPQTAHIESLTLIEKG